MNQNKITINGKECYFSDEKNLLEVIRKAGFELPTFCYHSELSVYGACRLCLVEIDGMGIQPACSTKPDVGMNIKTMTDKLRKMRKIIVELLLANEGHNCPTCSKNTKCQLQNLARKLGITEIRFEKNSKKDPIDNSSYAIVRDPNKCVLCGDCVRVCSEIQGVGVIDFAYRGKSAIVLPSFGKNLNDVECVFCGQCVRVCPTGALSIKSEIDSVWQELNNKNSFVVAQIAPATRIGIKEIFNSDKNTTGKLVTALKKVGFDMVFDTSTAADLTVLEEGEEFLNRVEKNSLPLFTSCCPAWVKFAQQYYPDILENISTCKSPQGMFGSLLKEILPETKNIEKNKIKVVSIMPCSAKKYEARKSELIRDKIEDIDFVLTTEEIAKIIEEAGIDFNSLEPSTFDLPFGEASSAGVIFGNAGGVTEAVLRYLKQKIEGDNFTNEYKIAETRVSNGFKEFNVKLNNREFKIAVVNGLANARKVIEDIKKDMKKYDFIEVMACPGGCIGGAGQPAYKNLEIRESRKSLLYKEESLHKEHSSLDNKNLIHIYNKIINEKLKDKKHELLHTHHISKKRIRLAEQKKESTDTLQVKICLGTNCFLKGSEKIMSDITKYVESKNLDKTVEIKPVFCFEKCAKSPNVMVGEKLISGATTEKVIEVVEKEINK